MKICKLYYVSLDDMTVEITAMVGFGRVESGLVGTNLLYLS